MLRVLPVGSALLVLACAGASPSWAQEARDELALQEIVVTARKQEERLIDIPITVTAVTAEQIEKGGFANLTDLQRVAPSMTFFNTGTRTYGQLLFRGMNSATVLDTSLENASVFIDGVYYIGSTAALVLDDVERVEVVRGPQSAFLGRATFAGALNFVTRAPAQTFKGSVSAQVAQFDDYQANASIEGPLGSDRLSGRLSVRWRDNGGQYTNSLTGDKLGQTTDKSIGGTLLATPVDDLTIRLRGYYLDQSDGPSAVIQFAGTPQFNCGPFGGAFGRMYCGVARFEGEKYAINTVAPGNALSTLGLDGIGLERQFRNLTANVDWSFGDGYTLSSLTGWSRERLQYFSDGDFSPIDNYFNFQNRRQKATSEELRLSSPTDRRFRWLGGLYYLEQDYYTISNFVYGTQYPRVVSGQFAPGFVSPATANQKTIENTAAFGSVAFDLLDKFTVSLEGRYQRDIVMANAPNVPGGRIEIETKAFLPRLILDYKPREELTLYANVAKGNKPTQANPDIAVVSPERQAILKQTFGIEVITPEETLWNYELGIKGAFLEGRAYANLAGFYMKWNDRQGRAVFPYDFNGNGVIDTQLGGANRENFNAVIYPAGTATVRGFELEGRMAATDALTLNAALTYARTRYSQLEDTNYFNFFGTRDASGQDEARVPEWTAFAGAEYRVPFGESRKWVSGLDATYQGSKWEYYFNKAKTGDQVRVNLRTGIESERYDVTLFIVNAFDDRTSDSIDSSLDLAYDPIALRARSITLSPPQRRQVGLRASYRF